VLITLFQAGLYRLKFCISIEAYFLAWGVLGMKHLEEKENLVSLSES